MSLRTGGLIIQAHLQSNVLNSFLLPQRNSEIDTFPLRFLGFMAGLAAPSPIAFCPTKKRP